MVADTPSKIFSNPFTPVSTETCSIRLLELAGMVFLIMLFPFASLWTLPRLYGWQLALIRRVSTDTPGLPDWRQPLWGDGLRLMAGGALWVLVPLFGVVPLSVAAVFLPQDAGIVVFVVNYICYTAWVWGVTPLIMIAVAQTRRVDAALQVSTILSQLRTHGPLCIAMCALLLAIGLLGVAPLVLLQADIIRDVVALYPLLTQAGPFTQAERDLLALDGYTAGVPIAMWALAVFQVLVILPCFQIFQVLAAGQWSGRLAQRLGPPARAPAPPSGPDPAPAAPGYS